MRGLANLATALNPASRFDEALVTAEQLRPLNLHHVVSDVRPWALMNLGRLGDAEALMREDPGAVGLFEQGLVLLAQGRPDEAWPVLVRAVLWQPRVAQHLVGGRVAKVASRGEWEQDERARHLLRDLHVFLPAHRRRVKPVVQAVLEHPRVAAVVAELHDLEGAVRQRDDQSRFGRYMELQSTEFVVALVPTIQR